jgi:NTE family protein
MKIWKLISLFLFSVFTLPLAAHTDQSPKVILVLGSGGSRGLAHVGVIEELERLGITPDVIIGCSSGAIVGALYAHHKDIAKVKEILIDLKQDDLIDFSLFEKYAISTRDKLEKFLEENLAANDFSELQIPFVAVATDLQKGEPVYFQKGKLHPALLASSSLPGLFPPYRFEDRIFVDGGVCDPLPVQFAHKLEKSAVVIASDISPSLDGFDVDNLPQVVRKSFEVMYQHLASISKKKADVLLEMNFADIDSSINDEINYEIYEKGKKVTRDNEAEIERTVFPR